MRQLQWSLGAPSDGLCLAAGPLGITSWMLRRVAPPGHTCQICGKTFLLKTSLTHHKGLHRGETACPLCRKVFSRKGNMMAHMKTVHSAELPAAGVAGLPPSQQGAASLPAPPVQLEHDFMPQ